MKEGDSLDKALKELKAKTKNTKLIQELRDREYYEKPSIKKRKIKQTAIYRNKKFPQLENQ